MYWYLQNFFINIITILNNIKNTTYLFSECTGKGLQLYWPNSMLAPLAVLSLLHALRPGTKHHC